MTKSLLFQPLHDFRLEEFLRSERSNIESLAINADTDAIVHALPHAERSLELHFALQTVERDQALQNGDNVSGALQMAGAANTNGNLHHRCCFLLFLFNQLFLHETNLRQFC